MTGPVSGTASSASSSSASTARTRPTRVAPPGPGSACRSRGHSPSYMAVPLSLRVHPARARRWSCCSRKPHWRRRLKILIVDDDHDLLEALGLGLQLQWQGIQVITAMDGEAALDRFYDELPD